MHTSEPILTLTAVLLLIGVLASVGSQRSGVPALLLFLVIGMLAGSEGLGGIEFDNQRLAQSVGVVALSMILFAGGLDTQWGAIRPVLWRGLSLATVGVALTAVLLGAFARFVLPLNWAEALLLGAIVSSTDAAAVFATLRGQRLTLRGSLQPLLELESGGNDPMAVFLTIGLIQLVLQPATPALSLVPLFALQMGIGMAAGVLAGQTLVLLVNRLPLSAEGLYPVITLAVGLLSYAGTTLLGGSGFLAAYLAGLVAANQRLLHKQALVRFHDGLAWLLQIAMFLVLGLQVFPSQLLRVAAPSLALAFFLVFVARPAGVFASLLRSGMARPEKVLVSWVGLRGAAPIILATFPLLAGVPKADLYFNVIFFVVAVSVLLQGSLTPWVVCRLRLQGTAARALPVDEGLAPRVANSDLVEFTLRAGSPGVRQRIVDLQLPTSALVVLLYRQGRALLPRGVTVLEEGDTIWLLADQADLPDALARLGASPDQITRHSTAEDWQES